MTVTEIADKINRNERLVERYLNGPPPKVEKPEKEKEKDDSPNEAAGFNLKRKPYWNELKRAYTDKEIKIFIYEWNRIIEQFKNEVTATEEIQIVDLIKMTLTQYRSEEERQKCVEEIQQAEIMLMKLKKRKPADDDEKRQQIDDTSRQERVIAAMRQAYKDYGTQIKDCLEIKNKLMSDLKATREKRLQKREETMANFTGWLQTIYNNPDVRREMSVELEKMRMSTEKAKLELEEYHKYIDGHIDQPLLTPETVKEDNH